MNFMDHISDYLKKDTACLIKVYEGIAKYLQ